MKEKQPVLKHRDLSWLSFNHRVLQEAADRRNPLYERIRFLAIYSSNLDEFFRVRVASLLALLELKKKAAKKLAFDPAELLARIRKVVTLQQEEFGEIFRNSIRRELRRKRIAIVNEGQLTPAQRGQVLAYFRETVAPLLRPVFLVPDRETPFLENRALYLVIRLMRKMTAEGEAMSAAPGPPDAVGAWTKPPETADAGTKSPAGKGSDSDATQFVLMEIPVTPLGRFYTLPFDGKLHNVMFLDDVIRTGLQEFFPQHDVGGARAIKLSRDAELYIDDEFSGDLVDKIKKAVGRRAEGLPSRLLYDQDLSKKTLAVLVNVFRFRDELVPGGRYHNFHNFFDFPNPLAPDLEHEPWIPGDPEIPGYIPGGAGPAGSLIEAVRRRDILLYYPYHSYGTVVDFLREAADDPAVTTINITLYRIARDSKVVEQLIHAAKAGKGVTAFVEVKARFDEESNFYWAEELQKAGARIFYSFPGLKVHAKLCLVSRRERGTPVGYGYLATGNFNEKAAKQYTDFGMFTADPRITEEMQKVFNILERRKQRGEFTHLIVSPYTMRDRLGEMIDREVRNAAQGGEASIIAKMNSLEDRKIIARLYEAGNAGVKITLLVRGICCLIPSSTGPGRNIEVISIVDRFLEHARVWIFNNGGDEEVYLSSADWMNRNLSRRIECAFPVYDPGLRKTVRAIIDLQLKDTVKARIVNKTQDNRYRKGAPEVRSQYAIRDYLGFGAGGS